MSGFALSVFPQHQALLAASAISPEVARERGYVSADSRKMLERYGFAGYQQRVPALVIPVRDVTGAIAIYQARPDSPRVSRSTFKPVKYETPGKSRMVLDVPVRVRAQLGDPAIPLWITEGCRKADSAVSAGLCCIALLGVWNWRGRNSADATIALGDWESIALKERRAYIAFDSDVMVKPSVRGALERLGRFLASRGADVRYVYLPEGDDAKTGLDDYLAAAGGADELITGAEPVLRDLDPPPHTRTGAHPEPDLQKQVCAPDGVCAHTPLLAHTADLLASAADTVEKLGVTGESRIVRGTYLTAVSQVLPEPVSLVVKGSSAGGKSYGTRGSLRLVPDDDMYQVTAGSQRSLIFTDEEFAHKTIVMFEATALREVAESRDGDLTAMLVRTLLSEGRIVYEITERQPDGTMGTRRIIKRGPTNLIVTTTADNLHHENETRLLSLTIDESQEQTRGVMRKIARRRYQEEPAAIPDLAPWHELFHWLKRHAEHRVYVPYADWLADTIPASVIRMRRDFSTLLGMIEAHAVLHQATRKTDAYGRIIATGADYAAVRDIMADALAITTGRTVKANVRAAVASVDALGGDGVTVVQVARHMKRDRSRATRGLKEACDLGDLTNLEDRPGRTARYKTGTDELPADSPALPDVIPDDAAADDKRTPAQGAQVSAQVTEGCAPCAPVRGGPEPHLCTICGEPLDPALIAAGYTDHGEALQESPVTA